MITVIIPTKNRVEYLKQALASVETQTLRGIETIVVNDSHSHLPEEISKAACVIENGARGPVYARNIGIRSAKNEFVAFLDDDDWWIDPDHLDRAAKALSNGTDFYFADGQLVFNDRRVQDLNFCFGADTRSLEQDNTILISSVCYKKSLHDKLGEFDTGLPYYWDWDWYLRVARSGARLQRHPMPSTAIRIHDANMSGPDTSESRHANLVALEKKHGLLNLKLKNHLSIAQGGQS